MVAVFDDGYRGEWAFLVGEYFLIVWDLRFIDRISEGNRKDGKEHQENPMRGVASMDTQKEQIAGCKGLKGALESEPGNGPCAPKRRGQGGAESIPGEGGSDA